MEFGSRQKGMGVVGWLLLILVFGGALAVGMKLLPAYMDHNTISKVLDGLSRQPGMATRPTAHIESAIQKRLKINSIRDFDMDKHMKIARDEDGATVTVDYEVRIDLVSNVDLVADFYKQVRLQ